MDSEEIKFNGEDTDSEENNSAYQDDLPQDIPAIEEHGAAKKEGRNNKEDDEELDFDEEESDSLVEKAKSNSQTIVIGVVGVLAMVLILVLGFATIGGSSRNDDEQVTTGLYDDFPAVKAPPGREQLYGEDEVKRMMSRALLSEEMRNKPKDEDSGNSSQKVSAAARSLKDEDLEKMSKEDLQTLVKKLIDENTVCKAGTPDVERKVPRITRSRRSRRSRGSRVARATPEPIQRRNVAFLTGNGGVIDYQKKESGSIDDRSRYLLPPGVRFKAKLSIGISTAANQSNVMAVVKKNVEVKGKLVLPKGSTISGGFNAGKDKIFINFNKVTIGNESYSIKGMAINENMPGVPAKVTKSDGSDSNPSKAGRIGKRSAIRAAQGAATRLIPGAGIVEGLARDVATEGLSEAGNSSSGYYSSYNQSILELQAGTIFEVITTD